MYSQYGANSANSVNSANTANGAMRVPIVPFSAMRVPIVPIVPESSQGEVVPTPTLFQLLWRYRPRDDGPGGVIYRGV